MTFTEQVEKEIAIRIIMMDKVTVPVEREAKAYKRAHLREGARIAMEVIEELGKSS